MPTIVTFPSKVLSTAVVSGNSYELSSVETLTIAPVAAPPVPAPPCWATSGQSNMVNLQSFIDAAGVAHFGFQEGAQPISFWDVGVRGWTTLLAALTANAGKATRIVWFQGETDNINGTPAATYTPKLVDVIARIRAALGQPTVPVLICQINPQFSVIGQALSAAVAQIPGATLVPTADLEWAPDNIHLDNAGATALVSRLLTF